MAELFTGINDFHFVRPMWLWAMVLLLLIWLFIGQIGRSTHWENYIAKSKLEALRVTGGRYSSGWKWALIFCWLVANLAAAGPAWKKVPVPTVRDQSAMVILLDLSRSMLAQDLAPDRLTRAKLKLIDILRARGDGQTALIAYAGDPHTLSPLTDDAATLEALLPALHPSIMPITGSNTEAAIELAMSLLRDAGIASGDLLLITDGVAPEAQRYIRDNLDANYDLSVLGVGSVEPVPIPQEDGGFIRDARGEIVLTTLNRDELQILAGVSRGRYVELQADDSDIQYLLNDEFEASPEETADNESLLYDSWQDMGYWLVLLLLPFAAWNFRKGAIYVIPLVILFPNDSQALSWDDLWLTKDQQAAKLIEKSPEEAASLFKNPDWKATADFRSGDYEGASSGFAHKQDSTGFYNLGNSLAFNQDFEGAINAYDQALAINPDHGDAAYNKSVIEQLMQQQEQQSQDQQSQNQDSQEQQGQDQNQQQNSDQQQSEQQSSDQQDSSQQSSQQQDQNSQEQSDQQAQQQPEENTEQSENQQAQQQADEQEERSEEQQESANPEATEEESDQELTDEQLAQMMAAEATPEDLQNSSEQWLRAIPDDPSGLLRRKFDYETRQRRMEERFMLRPPGTSEEERY